MVLSERGANSTPPNRSETMTTKTNNAATTLNAGNLVLRGQRLWKVLEVLGNGKVTITEAGDRSGWMTIEIHASKLQRVR
jgi:hypothetical protein